MVDSSNRLVYSNFVGAVCWQRSWKVKKRDLEKKLKELGWRLHRHGGAHDVWTNGRAKVEVPRHSEINEMTAKSIIRKAIMEGPG